ncbi:MAG: tRNA (adenosine(37)-N6)-threonylcarbamoyltransferase complex ATPase subunit type 1 TsaE [Armatimonadetes bacterium]|nr:tRNA (adenosine(37)-N6)-threonylcarbamoyltransferase complex ATPase subunit type 1 TsaE [Armatimonadota bacterium]MBI2201383.1 tRNA (adenosine(37)-N6)-threonylcarbamoyltransferase complex ATPase subunit type 1 TsaE [Armatimonadota bacterium]MBI2973433.1 tRNA (adenosine(37)-N6)-threonylcarbamoyltransferase complex ATPase subunit type 1 TsaE [Armatimonadota bacterium]
MTITTTSARETEALGRRLGALLRSGDVIALSGDLGAGKTALAHGIAEGVGASGYVASPTFTLVREYSGPVPIYHVDLYRLDTPRQIEDIGLDEILERPGIVVIEWAEKAARWLPKEHLWVTIRFMDDGDTRQFEFVPNGARYATVASRLRPMP